MNETNPTTYEPEDCDGLLLLYDPRDRESIERLRRFLRERYAIELGPALCSEPPIPLWRRLVALWGRS
jgi:hypothetical protein